MSEEIVNLNDVASNDFPRPSPHVLKCSAGGVDNQFEGYNPELHASPARRTKSGGWAKKSGNKKGFVVGQKKTAAAVGNEVSDKVVDSVPPQSPPENKLPPLEIPAPVADAAQVAESVKAQSVSNEAAAKVVAQTLFGVGSLISGYMPDSNFSTQYEAALSTWFEEMGGVTVRAWVNVALLSGVYGVNVIQARKPQSWLDKMRGRIAAWWVNRKSKKGSKNGNAEVKFDGEATVNP